MSRLREIRGRQQRGTALVEFAIAAPLLLLLLLATAEVGRMLSQYNTLAKSVRDAARYMASKASGGTGGVINLKKSDCDNATNLAVTGNINGTGAPLLPGLSAGNFTISDAGGGYVNVSASYTYAPMLGAQLSRFGYGSNINVAVPLKTTVVMRAL
jgi:Flp pilus assembly protein TadG